MVLYGTSRIGREQTMSWRDEPITAKQKAYILEMWEFSEYPLPVIDLETTTKGEACDYIDRYLKLAHESAWGIEHGY